MGRVAGLLLMVLLAVPAPAADAAGPAATKRVLAKAMRAAGSGSGAYVVDLGTGKALYAKRQDVPRSPASVEKLYTSATALMKYGPQGALTTTALADVQPDALGVLNGNLYLRGGGDPSFSSATAGALADALIGSTGLSQVNGRVIGDETAFDGLRGPPDTGYRLSGYVGPLSALTFNHGYDGRRFQANPPLYAAKAFTSALRARGVKVTGAARTGASPAGALALSAWNSPGIENLIASMNVPSDNFYAETLIKDLGASFGGAGTTGAGAAVVRSAMAELGIATTVVDGSGLSRADRTSPRAVVTLLEAMDASPTLADPFYLSLPTAGRTGTLQRRMRATAARDACHAKTGTLSNVSALAGYCDTAGGDRVAFAFLMNGVYPYSAQRLQDTMTVALARLD